jgi:hypothetical protein
VDVHRADGVPDALRRHAPSFDHLSLSQVRFTAVDYRHDTINLYFRVAGPFTPVQGARIGALAQAPPPPSGQAAEFGDLGATFRRWGTFFSGDSQVDPALLPTG